LRAIGFPEAHLDAINAALKVSQDLYDWITDDPLSIDSDDLDTIEELDAGLRTFAVLVPMLAGELQSRADQLREGNWQARDALAEEAAREAREEDVEADPDEHSGGSQEHFDIGAFFADL
jgi:hypothetical protein